MWFNIDGIINKESPEYTGPYPPYFDPSAYPWCADTAAQYLEMLDEYNRYRETHSLKPYFYQEQSGHSGKWKTVPLLTWGIGRKNQKHFPRTMAILRDIPGIVSVSFSLLDAGGLIQPHHGDSDAYIRGHLCLKMADNTEELAFQVNHETRHWQTGGWLLFCDAYEHGGWNRSTTERIVIIADIIHPEHRIYRKQICATILAGLTLNYLSVKLQIRHIHRVPGTLLKLAKRLLQHGFRVLLLLKIRL